MKAKEFLTKYKQDSSLIDINTMIHSLNDESNKCLKDVGSIPMIATYLNPYIDIKKNKKYIVIDAGGTNFRSAIAYYDDTWHIEQEEQVKMPGIEKELSKDEFFSNIASNISRLLNQADDIGFCFSYQVDMSDDLDGTLVSWSKEVKAKEVIGSKIGVSLLEEIKKISSVNRNIVIINDTTAVLLGGMANVNLNDYDSFLGFIFGTGMNVCYIEDKDNIKKVNDYSNDKMIINTEVSNFIGFPMGVFDKEVDLESNLPGAGVVEKMSSGRYLSSLIYKALLKAKEEKLLSDKTTIPSFDIFDLPLVSGYLNKDSNILREGIIDTDLEFVEELCYELIDRASKICAIICGSYAIKVSKDKSKPIGIFIEGSTFYKLPSFKERFTDYINSIAKDNDITIKLIDSRNKNLLGTALSIMVK